MIETPFIYPLCNVLHRIALGMFADYEVTGQENVPPMGPLIVVANHMSNMDPSLMGVSFPRRLRFLAKENIFQGGPIVDWFLRSYGAYPLNREGVDIRAYRWAVNYLRKDGTLVMFPEGTRSRGSLQRGKAGVVGLVLKTQAPLIPVGITGTEHIGHWMRVVNPTGRIRVNIGTVFSLPSIEGRPSKEVMESMTDMIMRRIADLLPESYQGVYRFTPKSTPVAPDDD